MTVLSRTLGSTLIAEGIETLAEYDALRTCGIRLMQGYLFARPALEALPPYALLVDRPAAAAPARDVLLTDLNPQVLVNSARQLSPVFKR
jgi:EAL domain-containing protein (putative c-di-GMP-specific phosphodiesterase class I)